MKRHRGKFDPSQNSPYELSRSRVENFIRCPACFFMQQVEGIQFPSIPGFNINEATDILLKRDFDELRGKESHINFLKKLVMVTCRLLPTNILNSGPRAFILVQKIG